MSQNYAYSSDGVSWLTGTIPTTNPIRYVTFQNGVFLASGDLGTVATSSTGLPGSWTVNSTGGGNRAYRVVWSPSASLFLSFDYNPASATATYYTSPTGATWTAHALTAVEYWTTFAASSTLVMITNVSAGSYLGGNVNWSTDGVTWTSNSNSLGYASFGGTLFGAFQGNLSNQFRYSSDAATWTAVNLPSYGYLNGGDDAPTGYVLGNFVAAQFGFNSGGTFSGSGDFIYSSNGTAWSSSTTPNAGFAYDCIADDGTTALMVGDGQKAYSTTNLSTWGTTTLPNTVLKYTGIAHGASEWVAVGPTSVTPSQIVMWI